MKTTLFLLFLVVIVCHIHAAPEGSAEEKPLPVENWGPESDCTPSEEEQATCKCEDGIHIYEKKDDKCVFSTCAEGDILYQCEGGDEEKPLPVEHWGPESDCTPSEEEQATCKCEDGIHIYTKKDDKCVFSTCASGDILYQCEGADVERPLPVELWGPKSDCTPTDEEKATCKCSLGEHIYQKKDDKCVFDSCAIGDQLFLCE